MLLGTVQARRPPFNGDTVAAYPDLQRSDAQHSNDSCKEETIMIRSLDYYDARAEEMRIRSLERRMKEAEIRSMAEQAALSSHPVVPYVLNLPVESPLYPADRYLRFANRMNKASGEFIDQEDQEGGLEIFNESEDPLQEDRDRGRFIELQ